MRLPKIIWKQPGGLKECPYFYRYVIDFGPFAIRLHHWLADDDHRAPHNHPYWFYTLVLKGGYVDVSYEVHEDGGLTIKDVERMKPGRYRYRPADHLHYVRNVIPGTWTLLISGKPSQRWGFWIAKKLLKRDKYFAVYGHHPCDPTSKEGVRLRPDGSRI